VAVMRAHRFRSLLASLHVKAVGAEVQGMEAGAGGDNDWGAASRTGWCEAAAWERVAAGRKGRCGRPGLRCGVLGACRSFLQPRRL